MQLILKLTLSLTVILAATTLAKRFPSLAGLIGVMPLTGALVLAWVYLENRGDAKVMQSFVRGALFGFLPSILFFFTAYLCLKKQLSLPTILLASFAVWLLAAVVHQWILK